MTPRKRHSGGAAVASAGWPPGVLDQVRQPMVLMDRDGRVLVANRAALRLLPEELLESGSDGLLDHVTGGRGRAALARVEDQGEATFEGPVVLDGSRRDVEVVLSATAEPESGGILASLRDLSARRDAEAARDEAERTADQVFDAAPVGLMRLLPDGRITHVNRMLEALTGVGAELLVGRRVIDVAKVLEGDRFAMPAVGADARGLSHVVFPDGRRAWVRWTARFLTTLRGAPTAMLVSVTDVTGYRIETERRIASEQRAQALFESAPVGMVTFDREFRITSANPAFISLTGYDIGQVVGMSQEGFLFGQQTAEAERSARAFLEMVSGARASASGEHSARTQAGARRWFAWSAARLPDEDGYIVTVADVSVRHEAEAAREEALAKLSELDALKTEFMSMVGHEFRTALTGIQGFSELMRDEGFTAEEMRDLAADINLDAQRLTRLVNDLLDLDKMEAGRMTIHVEPVDLCGVAADVVERFRPASPGNSWRVEVPELTVCADRDKLTQLLSNLLGNAVKYAPRGEIAVAAVDEGEIVHITVADHGPGIPATELERIFERYTRVDGWSTRAVGGTGLGLPIVREIARLHGGRAWAESRPGGGATFHVTLGKEVTG